MHALFASIYTKMWFDSFRNGSEKGSKGPWMKRFLIYLQKVRIQFANLIKRYFVILSRK